ncbi:MAG: right-handed parallel beta-helix repeat-containing protein [Melioribacteraceae bacterium]|nr:right-handed parallel beta-helix repeat-containing protein [Melioribacteraceae bacterium]MCF8356647.1 right-handed parallel beta-helix repeat-containing protein [Melioribacteraceae bacterium]MCF8396019.1 right-handed parallel beta-helix repeat-containing protein [Melioribacteraceae bacterium]MCF8421056.1 right-handed parallel beta-helix repeat-containing protein [Melioribacteraceae bacterium]
MRNSVTLIATLLLLIFVNLQFAQDIPDESNKLNSLKKVELTGKQKETGDILYSIDLIPEHGPLGVTIINSVIYITSSDGAGSNYWDTYSLDGTHLNSVEQGTSSSWGYRDLAFDGTYILASDDNDIDKIDPATFEIVSTITNETHSPHRGLAYDPNENAIYSTNFRNGPCIKIDAETGELIKELKKPDEAPYGIALDRFTYPNYASLWYAEPTSYGTFRISRVDTTIGNINFSFDLSGELPDSSLSGGLEIINDHPDYPDKIIAVSVDQRWNQLHFIDITDAPEILPASLEEVNQFGGWDNEGIITAGMVQYSDYLYAINSGDLWIYDIATDPTTPNHLQTVTIGDANKIFLFGDLLFITVGGNPNSFSIYKLTDPLNPVFKSTFDTGNPILDMVFDDVYAFVVQTNIPQMTVYDFSDLTNPVQHDVYNLEAPGTTLEINNNRKLLFIGYYEYFPNYGIELVDISDMNSILRLDDISTLADFPQKIALIDDQYAVFALNWNDNSACRLTCYNYSDSTDMDFIDSYYMSWDTTAWDMMNLDGILCVTIPGEGLKTFYFDPVTETYFVGPILEHPEPLDLTSFIPAKRNALFDSDAFLYESNGLGFDHNSVGSEPNRVIKVKKPGGMGSEPVQLSMMINPPEAANNGCSTIPATGVHEYDAGTEINLYAVPNEEDGWYFIQWTGDVSGSDLIVPIVLDRDKVAQANFDKLELTVSGTIDKDIYCPTEIVESPTLLELPFLVCASDVDGWFLSKISFRASGTGNDAEDISQVNVYKSGSPVYTGTYPVDNGTIDVTFSPPISIGPGQCVPFKITYDFGFDPETYAEEETKSFHVESFGVNAVPWTIEGGDIVGQTKNDSLVFARVANSDDFYFSRINDAVNSETTQYGDTCLVCEGIYNENIQLMDTTKAVVVKSINGPDNTIVAPAEAWDWAFLFHGSPYKIVDGFTIQGSSKDKFQSKGIAIVGSNASEVLYNKFVNMGEGVSFNKTKNSKIRMNEFINTEGSVSLYKSNYNEVYSNEMEDVNTELPTISVLRSDNNYIHYNRIYNIESGNTGMYVKLNESSHNKIQSFYAQQNSSQKRLIRLENNSNGNEIVENENFEVEVYSLSDSNQIHNNQLKKVKINDSNIFTWIENNIISNSDECGIYLFDDEFRNGTVRIKNNTIFNNAREGVRSWRVSTNLFYNDIYNNGTGTDKASGISFSNIYVDGVVMDNNIYDNGKDGVSIYECRDVIVSHNNITGHDNGQPDEWGTTAGVLVDGFGDSRDGVIYIIDNYIADNCTGIEVISSDEVTIRDNTIDDSFCWNTGIHLSNSSASISGNNIRNNSGNGVFCENGSIPVVSNNNILGNSEFGVNNSNTEGNILADNNFWGSEDGPGTNGFFGDVDVASWLEELVSVVASPARDTVYSSAGLTDSTILHLQNLAELNDILTVNVSDDKGWITSINNEDVQLEDSSGYAFYLNYEIPGDASEDEIAVVNYSVTSLGDSSEAGGSFFISAYLPRVTEVNIPVDMITISTGDTIKFSANAYDQYGRLIPADFEWNSSSGSIDTSGVFIAGNTSGEVEIIAAATGTGISDTSHLYAADEEPVLVDVYIEPDSISIEPFDIQQFNAMGLNQFDYPYQFDVVWSTTGGGSIDFNGVFTADSLGGTFYVIAENEEGAVSDSAKVVVLGPSSLKEQFIPEEFSLYQNYPNPFNPSTTIRFGLKEDGFVRLEIYNILGERISLPVNEFLAAGMYDKTINFGNMASGMYIYRLDVRGKFTDVKKMLLVK